MSKTYCNVTPSPPHAFILFSNLFFLAGRWSTSGWGGNAHFFTATQEYDRGRQEKIKQRNKHEQCLALTQVQKESYATLCIPDSIYGLTLAWVTSENSTKLLECRLILTHCRWTLSHAASPLCSGVRCWLTLSVVPRQLSAVQSPTASQLLCPANSHSRPLTTSGYGKISGPRILCLVSRQNRQRNRLPWRETNIVLYY